MEGKENIPQVMKFMKLCGTHYREANDPLSLQGIQNVSAIIVPNSFEVGVESMISLNVYYLIYYQQREAVILDTTALNIVQVSLFISQHWKHSHPCF